MDRKCIFFVCVVSFIASSDAALDGNATGRGRQKKKKKERESNRREERQREVIQVREKINQLSH